MDMLTFDLQVEIAEKLGYRDKNGRRAVEHFMQSYFLHATRRWRSHADLPDLTGSVSCQSRAIASAHFYPQAPPTRWL